MAQGALLHTSVFLFMFAFGFLLAGKRPILKLSTRALLVVLFGTALSYALSEAGPWHSVLAVATGILNCLFIAFAVIDYRTWRHEQERR